jgi:hypothetical protein
VAHEAERVVTQEIAQVLKPSRRKIIDADDEVSFVQKTLAKMGTEKSCSACDKNAPCRPCGAADIPDDLKFIFTRTSNANSSIAPSSKTQSSSINALE